MKLKAGLTAGLLSLALPTTHFAMAQDLESMTPDQRNRMILATNEIIVLDKQALAVAKRKSVASAEKDTQDALAAAATAKATAASKLLEAATIQAKLDRFNSGKKVYISSALAYRVSDKTQRCSATAFFRFHCTGLYGCEPSTAAGFCTVPQDPNSKDAAVEIEVLYSCGETPVQPLYLRLGDTAYINCF